MPDEQRDPRTIVEHFRGQTRRTIVATLVRHFGLWVPRETLIAAAYGMDPNGGPADPSKTISVILYRMRPELERLGVVIEGRSWWGNRMRWRE